MDKPEDLPMLKAYVAAQTALTRLREDREGAALLEYSLLIGLIAVAAITAVSALSSEIGAKWTALNNAFN
jgi:pilus assembly protein Flp/PilA